MNQAFDVVHAMRPGLLQLHSLPPLSLYVHLPWCIKKCPYCDFNSHEWQDKKQGMPEDRYIDALLADLETSLPLVWGRPVHSVFIGGGTPSLFEPASIDRLISGIRARLPLEAEAEITLEANPGTFEKDRFKAFRAAGVTRLSLGVQSFSDAHLKALGRVHNRDQAMAAVEGFVKGHRNGLELQAASHFHLSPHHRTQYLVCKTSPCFARGGRCLRNDGPDHGNDGRRGFAKVRSFCLCEAGPQMLAQLELLAVWRLLGHWCRGAQQT